MKPNPIQVFSHYFQSSEQVLYHKDEQNRFTFFDNENVYLFIPSYLDTTEDNTQLPISFISGYSVYKRENSFTDIPVSGKVSSSYLQS